MNRQIPLFDWLGNGRVSCFIREDSLCSQCSLGCKTRVYGEGSLDGTGRIIFLGEAPGKEEDLAGRPFVGPSGKILLKALKIANISRTRNWTTNVIHCRPPENQFWSEDGKTAQAKCYPGFIKELKYLLTEAGYRIVVPLGNNALSPFKLNQNISSLQGEMRWVTLGDFPVFIMPTYHPSFILRQGGENSQAFSDWTKDFLRIADTAKDLK